MSGPARRVLHVEDDELNRDLVRHVVALVPGWTVVAASTVAEARAVIEADDRAAPTLGLVLADLDLPDGSGDELVGDLRRRGTDVEFWAVTGDASAVTAARLRSIGIGRVLVKPFDIAELIADIAALG